MLAIEIVIIVASVLGAVVLAMFGAITAALAGLAVVGGGVLGVAGISAGIFYLLHFFGLLEPRWWGRWNS